MAAPNITTSSSSAGEIAMTVLSQKVFFSSLENELVHHWSFKTRDEARAAIFDYIEVFDNRQCRHQSIDYVSPAEYERLMAVA